MSKGSNPTDLDNFRVKLLGDNALYGAVDILQSAEISDLGDLFHYWRENSPDLEALVAACCEDIQFPEGKQKLIEVSAAMAAEENNNPYHNNHHFREVFALTYMMAYDGYTKDRITKEHFARRLSAALLHDYKHDGLTNTIDGGHQQFRLEQQAFDMARSKLVDEGFATQKDLRIIEAMILATDASVSDAKGAISPADSLKNYVEDGNEDASLLHPRLRVLHDENLVDTALLLHDADIGVSAAISPSINLIQGRALQEEWDLKELPDQHFFLDNLCRRRLYSRSAQELLQPSMNEVLDYYDIEPAV